MPNFVRVTPIFQFSAPSSQIVQKHPKKTTPFSLPVNHLKRLPLCLANRIKHNEAQPLLFMIDTFSVVCFKDASFSVTCVLWGGGERWKMKPFVRLLATLISPFQNASFVGTALTHFTRTVLCSGLPKFI